LDPTPLFWDDSGFFVFFSQDQNPTEISPFFLIDLPSSFPHSFPPIDPSILKAPLCDNVFLVGFDFFDPVGFRFLSFKLLETSPPRPILPHARFQFTTFYRPFVRPFLVSFSWGIWVDGFCVEIVSPFFTPPPFFFLPLFSFFIFLVGRFGENVFVT